MILQRQWNHLAWARKELIKSTFYIEEWLKIVLELKREKQRDQSCEELQPSELQ